CIRGAPGLLHYFQFW
nr:immunoglobulin heavy chain junction region [Macaca mulatta]MOW76902.1 immunoglobulin heavy chain junction region [Macaca mulatta]MOW78753.1 immunoglobulin heavy chain junction region [Macaca mulatta]MOW79313.1 immunoglobulin heavy chain junction region [Macaca mulatta]MOW80098.1 immunoglobulin heavy chain junction region [Macaca mulatta]